MKIEFNVDLNEFVDEWIGDIDKAIKDEVKSQIMLAVKKDPRYKAFILAQAEKAIQGLK